MAVRVRMGEKEILQAMKQSILMLMASCQESDEEDDNDEQEEDEEDDGMGQLRQCACKHSGAHSYRKCKPFSVYFSAFSRKVLVKRDRRSMVFHDCS